MKADTPEDGEAGAWGAFGEKLSLEWKVPPGLEVYHRDKAGEE